MYTAEISRGNPSCFLFMIDQSGSMSDSFGSGETKQAKANQVADAINRLLTNLVIRCTKSEGVRDYFDVGVFVYGKSVGPGFGGALAGRELVPISEIADNPARVEERTRKVADGAGGLVDQTFKLAVWFDPVADGGTPMCAALQTAQRVLESWVGAHPSSFPPIVINITDGESTDGEPATAADALRNLSTVDGNVLLFNLHLSASRAQPVMLPSNEEVLPDQFARLLFGMSSVLPEGLLGGAKSEGFEVTKQSRGFVFNADPVAVIQFLDIGTKQANLR